MTHHKTGVNLFFLEMFADSFKSPHTTIKDYKSGFVFLFMNNVVKELMATRYCNSSFGSG